MVTSPGCPDCRPRGRGKSRGFRSAARRSPQLAKALTRLGKRIQEMRLQAQLTQEELAHRAGLDGKHLQEIETGKINTTIATLVGIAKALDVKLVELFTGV